MNKYQDIADIMKDIWYEFKFNLKYHIISSLGLTLIFNIFILFFYTIFNSFCFWFKLSNHSIDFMTTVLLAPFIEETFKFISIRYRIAFGYGVIFIFSEMIIYVFRIMSHDYSFIIACWYRLPGIILHTITILIQKYFNESQQPKIGFQFAIIIHMTYNLVLMQT